MLLIISVVKKKSVNTASFDVNFFNEHFATIGEKLKENFKQNVYRSNFPVNKNTFVIYDTNRHLISASKWCFSNFLKIAKILPLHTNGNKTEPGNYRPISFLSC